MFYAKAANMKWVEDLLLRKALRHNMQVSSNAPPEPGFVYIIQGKKFT